MFHPGSISLLVLVLVVQCIHVDVPSSPKKKEM